MLVTPRLWAGLWLEETAALALAGLLGELIALRRSACVCASSCCATLAAFCKDRRAHSMTGQVTDVDAKCSWRGSSSAVAGRAMQVTERTVHPVI